jgi:hypothetical protein
MTDAAAVDAGLLRVQRGARVACAAGALISLVGAIFARTAFEASWLFAFVFWTGLGAGCLGFLMLHHMTGGGWGLATRRIFEAGALALTPMAACFLPLLIDLGAVFPWARKETVAADHLLHHRSPYLAVPFVIVRVVICFGVWIALARVTARMARAEEAGDSAVKQKLRHLCGPGLVVLGLTVTMFAIDWIMSLETHWFSTVFGLHVLVGDLLGSLCFAVIVLSFLATRQPSLGITEQHLHDLGNFLLAFTMLWAYLAFTQFLIIWYGNTAEDVGWYVRRVSGAWQGVALSLIVVHFAVPFFVLLSRAAKRSPRPLAAVAATLLAMRVVDHIWMMAPSLPSRGLTGVALDVAAFAAVGGAWLAFFAWRMRRDPPVPRTLAAVAAVEAQHGAA